MRKLLEQEQICVSVSLSGYPGRTILLVDRRATEGYFGKGSDRAPYFYGWVSLISLRQITSPGDRTWHAEYVGMLMDGLGENER
jgi:hypothetical protein